MQTLSDKDMLLCTGVT